MKTRMARKVPAVLVAALGMAWGCLDGAPAVAQAPAAKHTPTVFVPGVTGTQLRDPSSEEMIWGSSRQLFRPHDGGYLLALPLAVGEPGGTSEASHSQAVYEPVSPIWQLRLPGWTKMIYGPLRERFEAAGYRLGELIAPTPADDLFFFNYDWRYGNLDAVRRLDRQLEALSEARGGLEVDLICQSNAAKICRWLVKYGTLDVDAAEARATAGNGAEARAEVEPEAGADDLRGYRIRKLILVGASNSGALRVLQLLTQGRTYVPVFGRRLHPETFFTIRPLFEDLPADRDDLFFDASGKTLPVDLFEAGNWAKYGWSIFGRAATERLREAPRVDLFGEWQDRLDYLQRQLQQARRLQVLLARDTNDFPAVRYYRLENTSSPTIDRALLVQEEGEWRTFFLGDAKVDRDPVLKELASAKGDGHAVLSSQRGLSPQEEAAVAGTVQVAGGHFDAIIQPQALEAILEFLAAPVVTGR